MISGFNLISNREASDYRGTVCAFITPDEYQAIQLIDYSLRRRMWSAERKESQANSVFSSCFKGARKYFRCATQQSRELIRQTRRAAEYSVCFNGRANRITAKVDILQ